MISLALAIQSVVPVIALGVGLHRLSLLAKRADTRTGELATSGVVLVVIGGAAHSAWKIVLATVGTDAPILERALLGCMMPGFAFLALAFLAATGIERARRGARVLSRMAVMLLVLGLAFGMSQSGVRALEVTLLVLTLIAASVLLVRAMQVSLLRGLRPAMLLFAVSLVGSFVAGLIGAMDFTEARAWTDQSIRSVAHAMFASAAWSLSRRYMGDRHQAGGSGPAVESAR